MATCGRKSLASPRLALAGGITTAALSETMLSGDVLEVVTGNTSGSVDGYADYIVDAILDLPYTSGTPSNTHGAIGRPIVRQNASGSNSGTDTNLYIWKNSNSTTDLDSIMIATGGDSSVAIVGFRIIFGGTTVAANPGGSGLTALSSMTIGDTDYSITGSGGGGASDWVRPRRYRSQAITASRIVHSNAAGDELVFGHVTTALINDMAVTGDKIEDNTIDSRHLDSGQRDGRQDRKFSGHGKQDRGWRRHYGKAGFRSRDNGQDRRKRRDPCKSTCRRHSFGESWRYWAHGARALSRYAERIMR